MWESPIYKLNQPVGEDEDGNLLYKQVVIDVTRSAPTFTKPGIAMTKTLEEALRVAEVGPDDTILDFGAGKLRNTIFLLEAGFKICAVEFAHQFARSKLARNNLALAESEHKDRFTKLVYPHEFKRSKLECKLILLINVVNIMPVPLERLLVLQQCQGKLQQHGHLLWYTHRGDQSYQSRQILEYQIGDGHYIGRRSRLKTFYKEYPIKEIYALMSQAGFSCVKSIKAATWRNQALIFQKNGSTALSRVLTSKLIDKGKVVDESIPVPKKVKPRIIKSRGRKTKGNPNPSKLAFEEILTLALTNTKQLPKYNQEFEELVMKIFEHIFYKELINFRLEKQSNVRDVIADCREKAGFFQTLKTEYLLRFGSVIIECRNKRYKVDDQAFEGLGKRSAIGASGFSILVYRGGLHQSMIKRCRRTLFDEGKVILPFADNDLIELLKFRKQEKYDEIENFLLKRLMEVIRPGRVFISYSRKDKKYLEELRAQLADLKRRGLVSLWDDTKMRTGKGWREQIRSAIGSVDIAVFLVSSNFQASDFIAEHEVAPLLATARAGRVTILPVMVKLVILMPDLSRLQFVNDISKPLSGMSPTKRAEIWIKLVHEIQNALT